MDFTIYGFVFFYLGGGRREFHMQQILIFMQISYTVNCANLIPLIFLLWLEVYPLRQYKWIVRDLNCSGRRKRQPSLLHCSTSVI